MIDATFSVFTRVFRCIHPSHIVSNQMLTMLDWDYGSMYVYLLEIEKVQSFSWFTEGRGLCLNLKMKIRGLVREPITEVLLSPSGHSWPLDPGHDPLGQRLPSGVKKDHWQAGPRVVAMETTGARWRSGGRQEIMVLAKVLFVSLFSGFVGLGSPCWTNIVGLRLKTEPEEHTLLFSAIHFMTSIRFHSFHYLFVCSLFFRLRQYIDR